MVMDQQVKLLDGGIASQLVSQGFTDIDSDPLWSARLLYTHREAIKGMVIFTGWNMVIMHKALLCIPFNHLGMDSLEPFLFLSLVI